MFEKKKIGIKENMKKEKRKKNIYIYIYKLTIILLFIFKLLFKEKKIFFW